MKNIGIAFTGGGTGGHINPLLAVAEETKKVFSSLPDVNLKMCYFGNPGAFSSEFGKLEIEIVPVINVKFRRYFSLENVLDILKTPFALIVAFWKVFWKMPDILFSKGGPGALPVVLAAYFFRVPIFIHESDSIPGMTNSISAGFAKRIAVSFTKALEFFDEKKTALVGNPIRPFLLEKEGDLDQTKAKKVMGFDPNLPLILVLGGSQGAVRINDFMLDNAKEFVSRYQVLHQTGTANFDAFKTELAVATKNFIAEERNRYKIIDFFRGDLKETLIASNLIISRAGSNSIFEIAYFKKPSILIPLKEAARNHQYYHAYEYAKRGGCLVIEEDNLKPSIFFSQLNTILSDKNKYQSMIEKIGDFAKPQAAAIIAKEIARMVVGS